MATLYTEAESNIRKTYVYLFGFVVFIAIIGWVASYVLEMPEIFYIALVFSLVSTFYSYWNSDKFVLKSSRAVPVKKEDYPELYRLTENLAISNGLPMPRLYVVRDRQPNAFATGRDPENGVVAVTTGLLEVLNKSELEAVLAHELGHIGNRDILLSTIVVVLVGTVVMVSDLVFRMAFYGRSGRSNNGKGGLVILVVAIAMAVLAPLMAQLIRLAISRKREYLADSTAALTTRYPEGLISALEKIGGDNNQLQTASDATAHLYFVNPFRGKDASGWYRKLFLTHPPIEDRVKKLRELSS